MVITYLCHSTIQYPDVDRLLLLEASGGPKSFGGPLESGDPTGPLIGLQPIRGREPGAPNGPIAGEDAPVGLRKYLAAASSKKRGRDTFPVSIEIRVKRHPLTATIEFSVRHPIQDALANPMTSAHSEAELSELLWQLGGSGATVIADARTPEEEHGQTVAAEEGGAVEH